MTMEHYSNSTLEIGHKLGQILSSEAGRDTFAQNPATALPEAGLSADLTIYADTADTVHLVVPASIDEKKLAAGDETYLEELGRQALGACVYRDLPK